MQRNLTSTDLGLFLIRAITGVVFTFHGAQKLFGLFGGYGIEGTAGFFESLGIPFPTVSVVLAGGAEFVGGLALLSGWGVRLFSLPLAVTMLVGAFSAHSGFDGQSGGMEYPLTLALVSAGLGLTGAGRIAVGGSGAPRASHAKSVSALT